VLTTLPESRADAGLLVLRSGVGASFVLLVSLKQAQGPTGGLLLGLAAGALCVTAGWATRLAAAGSALGWAWSAYAGLRAGEAWYALPVRAALYTIIFAALACSGPGRFSFDSWRASARLRRGSRSPSVG
jgi:hypothetical protein